MEPDLVLGRMYDALNAAMALGDDVGIARLMGPLVTDDVELYPSETLLDPRPCHGVAEVVDWLVTASLSDVRWRLESVEAEPVGTFTARGVVEGGGEPSGGGEIARFQHDVTLRGDRVAKLVASVHPAVA